MGPRGAPRGWILVAAPLVGYLLLLLIGFVAAFVVDWGWHGTLTAIRLHALFLAMSLGRVSYAINMAFLALAYVTILFAVWLFLPKSGPSSLGSYFRSVSPGTLLLASAIGILLVAGLLTTQSVLLADHVTNFHATRSEEAILPTSTANILPGVLAVGVTGPFVEEIYFRGLLLRWLGTKMPAFLAVILSAALFAVAHAKFALHQEMEALILTGELAIVGVVTATVALLSRSLWPSIVIHGTYNATIIVLPLAAVWLKMS